VAAILAQARAERGWSCAAAAARLGISRRMLGMLEHGQRVPSVVLAEALIAGYDLDVDQAHMLRSTALPNVGRDSPFRDGSMNAKVPPNSATDDQPDGLTTRTQGASNNPPPQPPDLPGPRFIRPGAGPAPRAGRVKRSPWA
jgi:transcriptional regulator with XRE-family HTH domain